METLYSPERRSDRLIATGRVILAASSLFAVWLDPSEPANLAPVAYGLLIAYLAYALAIAAAVWRVEAQRRLWRVAAHVFDLVFFSLFVFFTSGPASPFTAYFVFSLVCAALAWGWRGTLWTAIAALAVYFAIGLSFAWGAAAGAVANGADFDLNRVIIRGVYLVVMAVLLGYLGSHSGRTLRELSALASAPPRVPRDGGEVEREVLSYAAGVLGAPRVAIAWRTLEEEGRRRALLDGGRTLRADLAGEGSDAASDVAPDLVGRGFFAEPAGGATPRVVRRGEGGGLARWSGDPLTPAARDWLRPKTLVSVPVRGELAEGRLFALDRTGLTADELVLAEVVASLVAVRLDQLALTGRLARAAADAERVRLSRDLHDGVLQALTGIALRLEAVRRAGGGAAVGEEIAEVQRLIVQEQRDLRFFIEELRPAGTAEEAGAGRLPARLDELVDRLARQWGLDVDLDLDAALVPEPLARDVYHLVREALVNAARHGGAETARVRLEADGGTLRLTVEDAGRGFPFEGRFTAAELAASGEGPKSLRERVAALGGDLALDARPGATRIEIVLPPGAAAA